MCSSKIFGIIAISILQVASYISAVSASQPDPSVSQPFFSSVSTPKGLCNGTTGPAVSHAGFIGLKGDTPSKPKRSFFWFFEAETDSRNAPIILTMGGGPGASGMLNALLFQAPCIMSATGMTPFEHRWTEQFNLVALDHPIGVGYSYGTRVNSSSDAALDVYNFLQKFFKIYPQLSKNKVILSDGSYGGTYLAHIGTAIHNGNIALKSGKGERGDIHINLDSIVLTNPFAISHFKAIKPYFDHETCSMYRCAIHQVHNATTCQGLYPILPLCLESIHLAYEIPTIQNRVTAADICLGQLSSGSTNGILLEDIRKNCEDPDIFVCYPEYLWADKFFNDPNTKREMNIPDGVEFTGLGSKVSEEFYSAGDLIQPHQSLYGPLLDSGIRLLYFVGAQDANCAWPGILSSLKLLKSKFQQRFLNAHDVLWPSQNSTVRQIGDRAGGLTFILAQEAGHTAGQDQPELAKFIIEHWINQMPFF
ncbi:Alpha/Beta hydrolase protein [Crucibulum laeve]|uniref:Alpha/Beta hydrolase protein n=1 Tax=Crucibulum laeve TaxID=68775 RepID=A0A5C3LZD7_9AGAR|nr:Alpha/Beta hydrolase protein [Crucibulum laeve]